MVKLTRTAETSSILHGREADNAYGTAVTANKDFGLIQNFTPDENFNVTPNHALGARNAQQSPSGQFNASWSMDVHFQHGRLVEYSLGAVSHNTTSSDTAHTFTERDTVPSFTLEDGYNHTSGDVLRKYTGMKVNELTFSMSVGGVLSMNASGFGKTVVNSTTAQASVIDNLVKLTFGLAELKMDSDVFEEVQSFDLTITNNLTQTFGLGSNLVAQLPEGSRTYTGSFAMSFKDNTEYEYFLGGTAPTGSGPDAKTLTLTVTNGIALGSGLRKFLVVLTNAKLGTSSKPVPIGGGQLVQTFNFTAESLSSLVTTDDISEANW